MGYYDLTAEDRKKTVAVMESVIEAAFMNANSHGLAAYFSDADTYIRKNSAIIAGRLHRERPELRENIRACIRLLLCDQEPKIRQTAVQCLGETGTEDSSVLVDLGTMLGDPHHAVRNAVIGAIKKMGEKNPVPTLAFAKEHIHHPDPLVRREMVHGIELRGRSHPEEVLPILGELEFEENKSVQAMVVHVIGQVSYKRGCLEKVLSALAGFRNKDLVKRVLAEIVKTHESYKNFAEKSPADAAILIRERFGATV